jgi:hypothetical protein
MGFLGPVKPGMIEQLGLALDARSNIDTQLFPACLPPAICAGVSR